MKRCQAGEWFRRVKEELSVTFSDAGERVCSGSTALQSVLVISFSLARNIKKRLQALQPSLQQVIGVLRRVDPALGNLAETVSQVWDLLQTELEERRALDSSQAEKIGQSGTLLLHLFALGRLKCLQGAGFELPAEEVPLVSDRQRLAEGLRFTRLAVASYGANLLALVGLLQLRDAWPTDSAKRDKVAATKYLQIEEEQVLACGTLSKEAQEAKAPDRFKPWWILLEDDGDLILSIRGTSLTSQPTWLAATVSFCTALLMKEWLEQCFLCGRKAIDAHDYKRFVVCGHSLGGAVSLLLGMKLRAEACGGEDLEEGLMSVINRCDPVPHLSLDAALRMVLAAENLAEAGLSWQQTLSLVIGCSDVSNPIFDDLLPDHLDVGIAPLRIPGQAMWLVDAVAGRQVLAVDLAERLDDFTRELPEISVAQSALDHVILMQKDQFCVMSTYVYNMDKAYKRLES
ncbi:hypothetical protein AK812_SmicGene38020 [Symbiodinium microadriaticum]|uniref:Fungal lipase-type domain-containing protein n=1 Tax=Symbiodinium microadriaticum TaxID=2951 RepID=A0A1Q9CF30_SYMMI|nr:hypothetical protein AK812_SmicGene38020 [Symbiodinium microadriaticum]